MEPKEPKGAGGTAVADPPADERAQRLVDSLKAEIAKGEQKNSERCEVLDKELRAELKKLSDELAAKAASSGFSLPGSGEARHKGNPFMLSRAIHGILTGEWSQAPLEKEIMDEAKKRWTVKAMSTVPDSAGGFVVPIEVLASQLIPKLDAESVVVQAGATVLRGLTSSPTLIPRISGGTTGFWIGEGSTITAADMVLQQLRLEPRILAVLTSYSDLLGNLGNPAIETMITNDMALRIALAQDLAALNGSGASGQPTGVLQSSGVGTVTSFTETYDNYVSFVQNVRGGNGLSGRPGWVLSNLNFTLLWKMADVGATQQLERRVISAGPMDTLLGFPYKISTQLTVDDQVIFGNWADLVIAQWGGMVIATTNAVGFTSLQNHIRAHIYTDIGLRHAASFCIAVS